MQALRILSLLRVYKSLISQKEAEKRKREQKHESLIALQTLPAHACRWRSLERAHAPCDSKIKKTRMTRFDTKKKGEEEEEEETFGKKVRLFAGPGQQAFSHKCNR